MALIIHCGVLKYCYSMVIKPKNTIYNHTRVHIPESSMHSKVVSDFLEHFSGIFLTSNCFVLSKRTKRAYCHMCMYVYVIQHPYRNIAVASTRLEA